MVAYPLDAGVSVEWGRSNGRAQREWAHRLDNGLEDRFRRLSSGYRGPTNVEIGNALDAPLYRPIRSYAGTCRCAGTTLSYSATRCRRSSRSYWRCSSSLDVAQNGLRLCENA
jgi:hypothetical protein